MYQSFLLRSTLIPPPSLHPLPFQVSFKNQYISCRKILKNHWWKDFFNLRVHPENKERPTLECMYQLTTSRQGSWDGVLVRGLAPPSIWAYNLGQNKCNIWTTHSPISLMPKWRVFAPSPCSRLLHCFGRWRFVAPIYFVQDCRFHNHSIC